MSLSYAHEKLLMAVHALATGRGVIQERLVPACQSLLKIDSEFLSPELHERLTKVRTNLTSVDVAGIEGRIVANAHALNDEAAVAIAKEILELNEVVREEYESSRSRKSC